MNETGIVRRFLSVVRQFVGMDEKIKDDVTPIAAIETAGILSELQLAEYKNSQGCRRVLLAIKDGYCIYSMDHMAAPVMRLTMCSANTFKAIGMQLVRHYTPNEIAAALRKSASLRSYAWANHQARIFFWGPDRIPGLSVLPWKTCPKIQPTVVMPESSSAQSANTLSISSMIA